MAEEESIEKIKLQHGELGFCRISPRWKPDEPIVMMPQEETPAYEANYYLTADSSIKDRTCP